MLILKTQLNTQKEIFLKFINYTVFRGYYSGNKDACFLGQKGSKMRQNRTKIIQYIENCLSFEFKQVFRTFIYLTTTQFIFNKGITTIFRFIRRFCGKSIGVFVQRYSQKESYGRHIKPSHNFYQ